MLLRPIYNMPPGFNMMYWYKPTNYRNETVLPLLTNSI